VITTGSPYLLLSSHHRFDEVHSAVRHWWQVKLAFDCQDVVDVKLALHGPIQLASADTHRLHSIGKRWIHACVFTQDLIAAISAIVVVSRDDLVTLALPVVLELVHLVALTELFSGIGSGSDLAHGVATRIEGSRSLPASLVKEDLSLIIIHTTDLESRLLDRFGGPVTLFIRVKVPDSIWLTNRRLGISTFIVLWDRIAGLLVEAVVVVIGVVALWEEGTKG
jgi:hypothetical protein